MASWFSGLFGAEQNAPVQSAQQPQQVQQAQRPQAATSLSQATTSARAPAQGHVASTLPAPVAVTEDEARALAAEVKSLGDRRLAAAWSGLRREFEVLKSVWQSQAMHSDSPNSQLQASLEQALAAQNASGVELLRSLLSNSALNNATESAIRKVDKGEKQARSCGQLASRIAARQSATGDSMVSLLRSAEMSTDLESRVRRALGMPPSKAEAAKQARQSKAAEAAAISALASQVSLAAGVSAEAAKKAITSAGGDGELALVMLLSEKSERDAKRSADAEQRAIKKQQQAEADAAKREAAVDARLLETSEVASLVSSLASSTQRLAWVRFQTEWRIQIDMWSHEAALAAAAGFDNPSFEEAHASVNSVLEVAGSDPKGAVPLLEGVLEQMVFGGLTVCAGVQSAAAAVTGAEWLARSRQELALRLESLAAQLASGSPVGLTAKDKKDLASLISTCDFGASLAQRVQAVVTSKAEPLRARNAPSVSL